MHVRSRKNSVAALATALVATAAVVVAPPLAGSAHAGMTYFKNGDLIKLKTNWGDEHYSLNVGGPYGSTFDGWHAQIAHDGHWDNPSQFFVDGTYVGENHTWVRLRNNHSQKCLTADTGTIAYVVQRTCDLYGTDPSQWWAGEWGFGAPVWIRNLQHQRWGLNTVMTQRNPGLDGSLISMNPLVPDHSSQDWLLESCLVNGAQQKDC